MKYRITAPHTHSCNIHLPASKSISNRALIINALAGGSRNDVRPALCDDTAVMLEALSTDSPLIDVRNAGTAMRFLTAYFCCVPGVRVITGSPRMQQRPIGILVDALRAVGAKITYEGKEGYPPLRIEGGTLRGGKITMQGDVSSQYISAILMVAPYMTQGLQLTITGEILSQPYIDMTIDMMQNYGIRTDCKDRTIIIVPSRYRKMRCEVGGDWSAASYWYEISYLNGLSYYLNGLSYINTNQECRSSDTDVQRNILTDYFISPSNNPIQGDQRVADYYKLLGIKTTYDAQGATITLDIKHLPPQCLRLDMRDTPDLAQTIIIGCLLKGQHFLIEGLNNLRIKECDRIDALQREARKLGFILSQPHEGCLAWTGERCEVEYPITIETYNDHRMAMAFAPAAFVYDEIFINNPQVVDKSYPGYWSDLADAGFVITRYPDGKETSI